MTELENEYRKGDCSCTMYLSGGDIHEVLCPECKAYVDKELKEDE